MTSAEAAVVGAELEDDSGSDRQRIHRSGVPSSTYGVVHRRALEVGWLVERYLPNPVLFGRPRATFALARRYPQLDPASWTPWSGLGLNALLWRGSRLLFGVFFDGPGARPTAISRELERGTEYELAVRLEVDLREPTVPVYFDFEGVWAQLCGRGGSVGYPRSLPMRTIGEAAGAQSIPARWQRTVALAARAPEGTLQEDPSYRVRRMGRRGVIRRAVRSGWIDRRAFLNPSALPPLEHWRIKEVVFVHGRLKPGTRPEGLFQALVGPAGIAPFLFVTDGSAVLWAGLAPSPRLPLAERAQSLRGVMTSHFATYAVEREAAASFPAIVQHQYERLLP